MKELRESQKIKVPNSCYPVIKFNLIHEEKLPRTAQKIGVTEEVILGKNDCIHGSMIEKEMQFVFLSFISTYVSEYSSNYCCQRGINLDKFFQQIFNTFGILCYLFVKILILCKTVLKLAVTMPLLHSVICRHVSKSA